jgi:general secretion pathway protein M
MLRPGSLLSRSLALALLLAALFGAYQLILLPVIAAWREAESTIEQAQTLLQRYRALAEQRVQLAERVSAQEDLAASASGYLSGPSDALAAAALQDRVKSVIEGAEGELRSTQILPAKALESGVPVRRTALRIQFAVSVEGLQEVLYELETGEPYLFIDDLNIREQRVRRRRNAPDPEPMLDVSIEVSGYVRAEATPSTAQAGPALRG